MRKLSLPLIAVAASAILSILPGILAGQPAASILSGRILDASGATVQDAKVSLASRSSDHQETVVTKEDGTFTFPGLAPSEYVLNVSHARFSPQTKSVTVESGKDTELEIRLAIAPSRQAVTVAETLPGYEVRNSATPARLDIPLLDMPQSVQVLNHQLLEEQQVLHMSDLTQSLSSVNRFPGLGMLEDEWQVRGFQTTGNLFYKNGFRDPATIERETANIEQVEVLKGPEGTIYGRGEPSGLINLITKQPLPNLMADLGLVYGSFGLERFAPDISGPLNASKTLLGRFNGAFEHDNSFENFVHSDHEFYAPALSWKPGPNTRFFFDGEYMNSRAPLDRGTVSLNGMTDVVPIDNFYGEPSMKITTRYYRAMEGVQHQLNHSWSVRVAFQNGLETFRGNSAEGASISADGKTYNRTFRFRDYRDPFKWLQADVTGNFKFAGIRHQLIVGTEDGVDSKYSGDQEKSNVKKYPYSINLFDPVYGQPTPPITILTRVINSTGSKSLYATDLLSLTSRWKLLLGGRWDNFSARSEDTLIGPSALALKRGDALTSRVGITYLATEAVSLYANTAQSFDPQAGSDAHGKPFDPTFGRQFEVGAKGTFAGGRLSATLAAYRILLHNVLTGDPANSGYSVQTGEQESRGIEAGLKGTITSHWRYYTTYALTKAQVVSDNTIPVGNLLYNVPRNSGSIWSMYDFEGGRLKGLSFGGGLLGYSPRAGDPANTMFLPAYTRLDASAIYRTGRYRFSVRVENLLDKHYFPAANTYNFWLIPGPPINFRCDLQIRVF